jgi:hypothetical protein
MLSARNLRQSAPLLFVLLVGVGLTLLPVTRVSSKQPISRVKNPNSIRPKSAARRTAKSETAASSVSINSEQQKKAQVIKSYGAVPMSFEANRGQSDSQVKFQSHGGDYNLFLTSSEAVLVTGTSKLASKNEKRQGRNERLTDARAGGNQVTPIRMKFIGGSSQPKLTGLEELPGKTNYFRGNNPRKWQTNIANYGKVKYASVYPGVDVIYYGNQQQLEYDIVLSAGADPRSIKLDIQGAQQIKVDSNGDLVLMTRDGELRQRKPICYQMVRGLRQEVAGRYDLSRKTQVGFKVDNYDTKLPLVIDPILVYSTFLGGYSEESANGIALDSSGNAYVAGSTSSYDFPTVNPLQGGNASSNYWSEVFITKLNTTGTAIVYSTYLGGSENDAAYGIAIDSSGNAYITGDTTSPNFPITANAFDTTCGVDGNCDVNGYPRNDVFVTKINSTGSALIYSTYLGGANWETGTGIQVDNSGYAYVGGTTTSTNFPTQNPLQANINGLADAFVTKVATDGTALVYSTYLGGVGGETAGSIALDSSANPHLTGFTNSTDFPLANPLQTSMAGTYDVFVSKLVYAVNPVSGLPELHLDYSTYLGGASDDFGKGIAVDSAGSVYLAGATYSPDFPLANAYQSTFIMSEYDYGNWPHVYVSKMTTAVNPGTGLPVLSLAYSTFLGGSNDEASAITVDASGNAFVTGISGSTTFPLVNSLKIQEAAGVFVTKINPIGSTLLYSTSFGSGHGRGIAVDANGAAYVAGDTYRPDNLWHWEFITSNSLQLRSGQRDAFVLKLADASGYTIDGHITGSAYPEGVKLTGPEIRYSVTDENGYYIFGNVAPGGDYTITPYPSYGFAFNPDDASVTNLSSNQTFDFAKVPIYSISGKVTNYQGYAMYNETVTLSGSKADTAQTDYGGNYVFNNVKAGGNYTVTTTKPGYIFTPLNYSFNNLAGNQTTADFSGRPSFAVTGHILANSVGVSGVTVTLLKGFDQSTQTAQTDVNGYYSFPQVDAYWDYTITPEKANYLFAPGDQSISWLYQNTAIDFVAMTPYIISGQINGLGNVTLTLSGSQSTVIQSDASGAYYFSGLPLGGNYTVTPTKTNYVFNPVNRTFPNLTSNQTANFDNVPPFTMSGHVADTAGAALSGVTMTLSGGGSPRTAVTNASGDYVFTNVVGGVATYVLTPSKTYYLFTLPSQSFNYLYYDPGAGFVGRLAYTISGRAATNSGTGISAATVTLTGSETGVTQTDASGNYSFANLGPGSYWVSVAKAGYSFYPLNQVFTNLSSNQTANFVSGNAGSVLLNPTADAYVRDGASASTNFGTATTLEVRTTGTANDGNNRDAYFKFGVATASSIGLAKLRIYASLSATGTVSTSAYPVAVTSWIESGTGSLTWSNKPALGAVLGSVSLTGTTYAWYEIDVTSYIKSELAAGRTVISIALHDGASSTPNLRINSRESTTNKPELLITPETVVNTAPVVNAGPDQVLALPLSATLDANVTDDGLPSPPAALTYTWSKVSGPGNVTFGTPNAVDTTASFSLNGTYVLQLQASDSALSTTDQVQVTVNPDPTILNLNPTADSYVRDGSANAGTNFGTVTTLSVRTDTVVNSGNNRDAYLKFDTTSATNVTSAKVRINAALSAAGTVSTSIYSVATTTWIESGTGSITWNNKPARGATPLSSVSVTGTTAAWYELDVTSYVQSEKAAGRPIVSFAIHDAAAATPIINFSSREAATNKPVIVITQAPSTAPKIVTMTPSFGPVGTVVSVSGMNFGASQGGSTIKFNSITASVSNWGANAITATVPAGAATGPVVVTVGGVSSAGKIFTVAATDSDSDADGMMDSWERMYFGGLTQTAAGDFDGDGLTNLQEYQNGRNPAVGTVFDTMLAVNLKVLTPLEFLR